MKPIKILCPTGHLSFTPLEKESFLRGCDDSPDFIIADAGSCDIGPRPLGEDKAVSYEAWQRADLEIMLCQARRLGIPMIVGSASDAGTNRGVDQFVDIIREIAVKHELAPFKLAAIYSEVPLEELKARIEAGEVIKGIEHRPNASMATVERTIRAVAVMNAEPICKALQNGADVVIAGRSSDCALFAAPLLNAGHSVAISYFTGKLLECASFCAEPYMGKESIMGRVEDEAVYVTALHPAQRCTPASLAGHAMYERMDPFREYVLGGYVDMSECHYQQFDERTTKVTGARFVKADVSTVKLEGAGIVGQRRLVIVGIRDPQTISRIDQAVDWSKGKLEERFGAIGGDYDVFYHLYGRNAVMKEMDASPCLHPHELCVVIEVICGDGDLAGEICALASRNLFYARLPGHKGTAGAAALMSDEVLITEPAYEWTLNHLMEVADPLELFDTKFIKINANASVEAA